MVSFVIRQFFEWKKVVEFIFLFCWFPNKTIYVFLVLEAVRTRAHTHKFSMEWKFRWIFLFNRFFFFQTRCTSLNIYWITRARTFTKCTERERNDLCVNMIYRTRDSLVHQIVHSLTKSNIFVEFSVPCAAHCCATVNKQLNRKEFQSNALRRLRITRRSRRHSSSSCCCSFLLSQCVQTISR